MFGLDTTTLAFIVLVAFSGAALVYALLFQKIEQENRTDKRLKSIKAARNRPQFAQSCARSGQ